LTLRAATTTGEWIVEGYRWGSTSAPWLETLAILLAIAVMTAGCVMILRHLRRRDRQPKRVADQWQTLAVMGELCPHGWQAQITVYGEGAPVPLDAPPARAPLVELEWQQFGGEHQRIAASRRAWARTIGGALQMMVDDRGTDLDLAQAERGADRSHGIWDIDAGRR
jgi:hypothetical protein